MRTHRSRSLTELGSFGLISLMRNAYAPVSQAPRSVWTTQESLTRMLAVGVVRLMGLACQIEQQYKGAEYVTKAAAHSLASISTNRIASEIDQYLD
jgi:hypothetical protein